MPEEKYYHLFDSTKFPVPDNYFDDYATRTSAAHEQEMQVARDMDDAYDSKLYGALPDSVKAKGLENMWKSVYNRMTPEEKRNGMQLMVPKMQRF